jgi:hypothetical protein
VQGELREREDLAAGMEELAAGRKELPAAVICREEEYEKEDRD